MMKIGAHGTKCKLPLGESSTFTFRFTESIGCTFDYTLPTDTFTDATILVPAHPFDVAFNAVTPSYSAVTDASDHGYFFRMGLRTQRIDLREPAQETVSAEESKEMEGEQQHTSTKPPEHSLIFEFREAPALKFHTNSSEFVSWFYLCLVTDMFCSTCFTSWPDLECHRRTSRPWPSRRANPSNYAKMATMSRLL